MTMTNQPAYLNLIEPDSYPEIFFDHPPAAFRAWRGAAGQPLFKTSFDLLTTLDPSLRERLRQTPLFKYWSGLLTWPACFAGTTVTEYAPVLQDLPPEEVLAELFREGGDSSLLIVKDLPLASPLLPAQNSEYAQKLVAAGIERGFFELSGQALAYVPVDFSDIDEYLGRLSHSRRKDLRRKMKSASRLSMEVLELGHDFLTAPEILNDFYDMYLEVFRQSEIHFDLLEPGFFKALLSGRYGRGFAVIYRQGEYLIGYNICLVHRGCLIDKYIGFRYPQARELNLYFVSWLYNLELALSKNLDYYVAGWTDPEVKASLGAKFTFTRHLVWIKNPLLRIAMKPLRQLFEADKKTVGAL